MSADCTTARRWLSAFRDGEALPDAAARLHVDECAACASWERALDTVTRQVAVRAAGSPDVIGAALAAWAEPSRQPTMQRHAAQILLVIAGLTGLALAAATAAGTLGTQAPHTMRDLVAMETALAVGFLTAAWRPDRYIRGLLPSAAVAGLLTMTGSTTAVASSGADLLREASHVPVLLGVLGLFVAVDALNAAGGRRR